MSGEIVKIGDATLYYADCREVLPTIPDNSIEMFWSDPPYGHSNHDGDWNSRLNEVRGIESAPIANDDAESMRIVVDAALKEAARFLRHDCCCCCCCCCGGGPRPTFAWVANRMDSDGLRFFHSVIWDKKNPGLGWRFRRRHEHVMIAHRDGGRLLWADGDRAVPNIFELMPPRERFHPNEKPIALVSFFIEAMTQQGHTVIDPFMGSGTTGVSCLQLGRKFIGIELDRSYFDVACERIARAYAQPRLFDEKQEPPKQEALL